METDSVYPNTCNPLQIAAKVLNPITLQVVEGGEFQSFIKQPSIPEDSIKFNIEKRRITREEFLGLFENAPSEEQVWKDFAAFTKNFHRKTKTKSMFSAPIRAGANIISYDNVIWQRLCEKYGFIGKENQQNLAFPRDNLDIQNMLFWWFEGYDDAPDKLNMDVLCEYFGIKRDTAHDAMSDVNDTIKILTSCMRLFRKTSRGLTKGFRGALSAY